MPGPRLGLFYAQNFGAFCSGECILKYMSLSPIDKIRVGVLRGGPSPEYEVSLRTGASVLRNLPEKYRPQDIFISRSGAWHIDGLERNPDRVLSRVDVVFNALHGMYGEDGQVQQLLESHGMPYTGSGIAGSALSMNKLHSKKAYRAYGLLTPFHFALRKGEDTEANLLNIYDSMSMPVVVKPASAGSSVGVRIARDFLGLSAALPIAFKHSHTALIEELIEGREATCGVIEGYRGKRLYSLLPAEIIPESSFFDYDAKYSGSTIEVCPGNFTRAESDEIQRLALLAHEALGLRHYSRSDFIVSNRGIYILETNTLPGLTEQSLLPKSLEAVGSSLSELTGHLVELARGKR